MNRKLLTDNHIKFINKNPWINDINFNNIDIIECKRSELFWFIRSLIEYKVIQCNIIIDNYKDRIYYNGKHHFTKIRLVNENNKIHDYLRDSNGNDLFYCEDKNNIWDDNAIIFNPYNDFNMGIKVNKDDLILTYNINKNINLSYVILAKRSISEESSHSYIVSVFNNKEKAIECANSHKVYRGLKYTVYVEEHELNYFDNDFDDNKIIYSV